MTTHQKKGGRRKLSPSEKLKYIVAVKLCTEDFYTLKAKATVAGMTYTELARKAITGCAVRQRMSNEQMDCIRKIAGIGNNLNQLARRANAGNYIDVRLEYLFLADKIDNLLNQIQE